jgi:uncharacterized protein YkwD
MTTHSTRRLAGTALLVAVLLAGLLAALVPAAPASASDDGGFAARMLELLNQQRSAASLPALSWSPGLAGVAEDSPYTGCGFTVPGRAKDMGVRNYFSHTILGCGTQTVFNVLSAAGIQSSASGENIAWVSGMTDPKLAAERLMNDLMADAGHRANILSPNYNTVGIGSWHTAAGQTWTGGGGALGNVFIGTQVFGHTTATGPQPAGVPTNVKATGGNGAVSVTWSPAAGPAPDVYGVFAWNSAGYTTKYATACATCTTATVTGLANGGTYYVTVYGYNAAGWGNPGTSNWVTVAAPPGAPTAVRILPGDGAMTGTWHGPTNPGTAIDGYALFVFDANGYTNHFAWVCPTCTTGTATGLVNGHSYYAVVYAHDPNGWGAPTVSGWIVAGTPAPPATVSATRANSAAQLSWAAATNSGAAIDMYGLFAFDANGYTGVYATACATCTSGTLPGLINGKAYTVAVYAHNARGWGAPTLSGTVTPGAP